MGSGRCCKADMLLYGRGSHLSSLDESLVSSAETESDEEDSMAGLTRRVAQFILPDDLWNSSPVFPSEKPKPRALACSPESTLCDLGLGCLCRQGSNHGSPGESSLASSPTCDPFFSVAREVARTALNDDITGSEDFPSTPVKCNSAYSDVVNHGQDLDRLQSQPSRADLLNRVEMMQQQNHGVWSGRASEYLPTLDRSRSSERDGGVRSSRPLDWLPSAWPPLQQQNPRQQPLPEDPGSRAVFGDSLGKTKRASVGTGVFFPRIHHEPRWKSAGMMPSLSPKREVPSITDVSALNPLDGGGDQLKRYGQVTSPPRPPPPPEESTH